MYNSVDIIGGYICEVCKKDGIRKIKKTPGLFHTFSPSINGEYKDLFGKTYSRTDLRLFEFKEKQGGVGVIDPKVQYVFEHYPNRENWDNAIGYIDIEVDSSHSIGFPDVKNPIGDIQLIGLRITGKTYILGIKELDVDNKYYKMMENVEYIYCNDQLKLVFKFIELVHKLNIDVLVGWHSEGFDIPYIINKIRMIENQQGFEKNQLVNALSPYYKMFGYDKPLWREKKGPAFEIYGLKCLDLLVLYKKFTYITRENYKLNHVAEVELGKGKQEFEQYKDLNELYEKNYPLFVLYNYRDCEILEQLEDKLGILFLSFSMTYYAGIQCNEVTSPIKVWESIIYNFLMKDKIIVKEHKRIKSEESYPGAYVFDPKLGISKWTASFDYASMYPTLIRELNMSYETIVESDCPFDDKVVYSDLSGNSYEGEVCRSVHSTFKGDKEGIFPKALKQLMNERKEWKKKMFAHSQNIKAIQDEIKRREGQND